MALIKTPVKGMQDFLPADMRLREHVLSAIKTTYATYGFSLMETPAMEHIENLTSKQGGDNEKLIFKVLKRGADLARALDKLPDAELADSGLRYDLTVPLARYYAANSGQLPAPFKALQIGSVWRADKPQKGRFRQFTQCDIDILGDKSNLAEITLLEATAQMLSALLGEVDIRDFTIRVNDRRILMGAALASGFAADEVPGVLISLDKADKIGWDGVADELKANGFAADVVDPYVALFADSEGVGVDEFCAPLVGSALDEAVVTNLSQIVATVTPLLPAGAKLVFDPTLVRGMGYYTGPIFEVGLDGYGFSVAGGGRYDEMIGKFSGQDTPACGFSIGFERIITIMKDQLGAAGAAVAEGSVAILVAAGVDATQKAQAFARAAELRAAGKTVTVVPLRKNLGRQIAELEAQGYQEFEKVRPQRA